MAGNSQAVVARSMAAVAAVAKHLVVVVRSMVVVAEAGRSMAVVVGMSILSGSSRVAVVGKSTMVGARKAFFAKAEVAWMIKIRNSEKGSCLYRQWGQVDDGVVYIYLAYKDF
ncbi:hypothetical protein Nepgr_022491 [Nepenthes gracilis]|uniref:Uncharacterized protein n=1 Tax=Nepenthes gracilis TaxID=150966 RepID=A0AAD3T0V8_NEPGR|nr:hypothetical protein Nepgr_022491 [Nepenthes gracilis]